MNKKGFTLVELLAVIVLLGLVALIAAPAITGIIKKSKDSLSDSQKTSIELSAKNWATDNMMELPEDGKCICVSLRTLQAGGYADLEVKDPKTGDPMNVIVTITRDEKMLLYEVDSNCLGACAPY
jgi:type IV pilus assembly protein PilA